MGLFSLEKHQGDLMHVYKYLIWWSKEDEARFFLVVHRDIVRNAFIARMTEHWHRLPREVVESPSLQTVKTQLVMVLGNLQ